MGSYILSLDHNLRGASSAGSHVQYKSTSKLMTAQDVQNFPNESFFPDQQTRLIVKYVKFVPTRPYFLDRGEDRGDKSNVSGYSKLQAIAKPSRNS